MFAIKNVKSLLYLCVIWIQSNLKVSQSFVHNSRGFSYSSEIS